MDAVEREAIVAELRDAFGQARDASPAVSQPLHVALDSVLLADGWSPSPARALLRFTDWPAARPEFFIGEDVVNAKGDPPRSNSLDYVLGKTWRRFSWQFPWPTTSPMAVAAVQHWLCRFREST